MPFGSSDRSKMMKQRTGYLTVLFVIAVIASSSAQFETAGAFGNAGAFPNAGSVANAGSAGSLDVFASTVINASPTFASAINPSTTTRAFADCFYKALFQDFHGDSYNPNRRTSSYTRAQPDKGRILTPAQQVSILANTAARQLSINGILNDRNAVLQANTYANALGITAQQSFGTSQCQALSYSLFQYLRSQGPYTKDTVLSVKSIFGQELNRAAKESKRMSY